MGGGGMDVREDELILFKNPKFNISSESHGNFLTVVFYRIKIKRSRTFNIQWHRIYYYI